MLRGHFASATKWFERSHLNELMRCPHDIPRRSQRKR